MRNKAINSLFSLVLWLLLAAPAIAQDGPDAVDYLALASLMLRDGNLDRAITALDQMEIITPEGVPLRFEIASAGDRIGAFIIDMVFIALAIGLLGLAAASGVLATLTVTQTVARWRGRIVPGKPGCVW